MLYSWSLADCAKNKDSKLLSKDGQKLWDRRRRPTAFASSALPTKRHRDRLKVLSVQPRFASFCSHRRSGHLSIRQLEPFGRSKVSPLRLCDGVESNDSVPDPSEKAQGQSQSPRTLGFRYTVPIDSEARGLVLLRQDWLRFRSWIIRRGRAEFLHYDIEAFSRFYHRRLDLMIARALEMALPLSLWFWRYRWRMRDPNVKRALASERGLRIDPRSAAELRALATRLGAAAIKLGQALSSRPDIVGPTFMLELQKLQDNVDPFPNREAWALMNAELGPAFISQLFGASSKSDAWLPNPVASASLGQVYRGRHADTGMEVAVKVQRPRLHLDVPLDLLIVRWLANWLRKYFRLRSDLPAILDEFGQRLFEEMDYVHEGGKRGAIPCALCPLDGYSSRGCYAPRQNLGTAHSLVPHDAVCPHHGVGSGSEALTMGQTGCVAFDPYWCRLLSGAAAG
ncbi:hypothetical protein F1559_002179 [Cyanidiococcus yangmingshanensis]|uniref:ABC1 atypical kinase-like domain-containing protein n=1 Tax=Cyanidiococcus yangmingshanensis TaxID=2690220 RepID=A0A7J7IR46_9RHOD|nr:hypothetical protein F1559_002179 [Cyanidiococcus yangmingshanensis]